MKKILKWIFFFIVAIPLLYFVVAFIFTSITISKKDVNTICDKTIYLNTNGIHLDIILKIEDIDTSLINNIQLKENEKYFSFGWGDEDFYLNTPTWDDLTFGTAFNAMFLNSSSLMHIIRYKEKRNKWIAIKINENELKSLNSYLYKSFSKDENNKIIILENKGYSTNDDFYRANGSYSAFNTCNSWVNNAFKESGLKACFWTPFDFGLMNKYI